MELFPAIDLRGGRCVRLVEGDFDRETVYGGDPVAVAREFASAGARWIHVVDLDAAKTGDPLNRPVVASIAEAVGAAVSVQAGGGVRSLDDAAALIGAGVARVVVGTAAVENTGLVAEMADRWPGRVAVGVDHRAGRVRSRGWTEDAGRDVRSVVGEAVASGAAAVIVTDIARDGRLQGPDIEGLSGLLAGTGAPIIASGGVSDLDDIKALAAVRVPEPAAHAFATLSGVIVGRAIYEGRVDVREALQVVGPP